jgi:hypothetical protein
MYLLVWCWLLPPAPENLFLNFSFKLLLAKKFVGWVRELIREGIEPNPGPFWKDLEKKLKEILDDNEYDELKTDVLDPLKEKIKNLKGVIAPTTNNIEEYFGDRDVTPTGKELRNANLIMQAIQAISGKDLVIICFLSDFFSQLRHHPPKVKTSSTFFIPDLDVPLVWC